MFGAAVQAFFFSLVDFVVVVLLCEHKRHTYSKRDAENIGWLWNETKQMYMKKSFFYKYPLYLII